MLYRIVQDAVWNTPAVLAMELAAVWVGCGALWAATRPATAHATARSRATRATMAATVLLMTAVVLIAHAIRHATGQ